MSNGAFDFKKFLDESRDSILNPKGFFPTLKTEGGLGDPILKALIYGLVAGVFSFLWSILNIGAVTGGLFGGAIGIMILIWSVIGAVIGVFIGGVVVLVLSAICGGKTDFEPNMRVAAALMVLMPINAFFGFAVGISTVLGTLISFAINLYGLWMLYHALTQTLKAKESSAKVLSYVLVGIVMLFLIVGLTVRRTAKNFVNKLDTESSSFFKDYEKELKKQTKELQKALEEMQEDAEEEEEDDD